MRILLVHNFYGSSAPSGENQVFQAEKVLLESHGHEVIVFSRHSDEIRSQGFWGQIKGGMATPWNPWMANAVRQTVVRHKPAVVHVHNSFPLISPSIFHAIGPQAARVLTLHNYRLFCPAGIPMREGRVCTECLDSQSTWPAVKHACYRHSRVATLPLALKVTLHRTLDTWSRKVEGFVALSQFQRDRMVAAGLPRDKVHVKPNFYPGYPIVPPWKTRVPYVVFVGRLTSEKGVESLLRAWSLWGEFAPELKIVGDGPLRTLLEQQATGLPVRFLGQLPEAEAQAQIAKAHLLILPSECFEGFPMVVSEAFAFGTPVAVSNLGPLPSIVEAGKNGLVFEAANPENLLEVVCGAWNTSKKLERLGQGARAEFMEKYTDEANYLTLMQIYRSAIERLKLFGT